MQRCIATIFERVQKEPVLTLPTIITSVRIALIPFLVTAMTKQRWGVACALFVFAAATDGLDGYLARTRNEATFFGAALDAFADKALIISCFTTFAFVETPLLSIPIWFVCLVLFKELVLMLGTLKVYCRNQRLTIAPTFLGKATMVAQVFFILWLFTSYFFGWVPATIYLSMLGVLLALVFATLVQYAQIAFAYWQEG